MSKKSFTDNPAEQFISSFQDDKKEVQEIKEESIEQSLSNQNQAKMQIPEGYKLDPRFIEKKSKRLNLLMQPSLYKKIQDKAKKEKKSVNDFIHSAMEELLK